MARIPSTQSLRVFRKAAETLNFTQAAEELHLTQSAVSHQIRLLEEQIGVSLFIRHRRCLSLSEKGRHFLQAVVTALDELHATIDSLRQQDDSDRIVVRAERAFWVTTLRPLSSEIEELFPNFEIEVDNANHAQPSITERLIAIHLGYPMRDPMMYSRQITKEECFPICAPSLLSHHPVYTANDLRHHRLLVTRSTKKQRPVTDWESWLEPGERVILETTPKIYLDDEYLTLEVALAAQGIALSRKMMTLPHLSSGQLIAPLDRRVACQHAYHFSCANNLLEVRAVEFFRRWLTDKTPVVS